MMYRMLWVKVISVSLVVIASLTWVWTGTPSYSVYRIQEALKTRDYAVFSEYVDIRSVAGHAVVELGEKYSPLNGETKAEDNGSLSNLLKQGLQQLTQSMEDIAAAGAEFAVQQAFRDPDRELPQIPSIAVIMALVGSEFRQDIRFFTVPVGDNRTIEVGFRRNTGNVWRVVAVSDVSALIEEIEARY